MTLKIQKRFLCQVSTIKLQPQNWSLPIRKEFTSYKPSYDEQGGESKWHNYSRERDQDNNTDIRDTDNRDNESIFKNQFSRFWASIWEKVFL